MPKRSGLGQRGLDLLISANNQKSGSSDSGEERKAETPKAPAKKKTGAEISGSETARQKSEKSTVKTTVKSTAKPAVKPTAKPAVKSTAKSAVKPTVKSTVKSAKSAVGSGGSTKVKDLKKEESPSAKEIHSEAGPVMIPLSKVEPNRQQPRKNFDEDALQELAESIRQFGIIQPLIVQKKDDYYEIIAGERRWRAARIASLKEVPVIIRDYTPREVMEISLIENIQREDLNPIEEAAAFRQLMEEYQLKQDEVAERVSKSRAAIANSIRLLNLDERVQDMVISEMLSTGHARALLAITDPEEQYRTAQRVFDEKLTVRDVEKLVRKMNEAPASPVKKQISDALQAVYLDLAEKMKTSLGTKVSISPRSAQKGKIEIEYYSSDELDRLCTLLNGLSQKEGG